MKDNKDRDEVLEAVENWGLALEDADESLRKDEEIVMAAVEQDGGALEYADESLKKDKEIVMAAVEQRGLALEHADESLQKDREVVLAAVKTNGYALQYADGPPLKDKEIVLAAVKHDRHCSFSSALAYADGPPLKDKEIVLAAVKQNGHALDDADKSLQKDREIVMAAQSQMDGQKILDDFYEFSQDAYEIQQFFENGDDCSKDFIEDQENLFQITTMEFPKWSLKFEESYGPAYDPEDGFWSGDIDSLDPYFSGEVAEFKIWLNINRQEVIEAFNLSADKIKKLDTIVKNQAAGNLKKGYQEIRYFEFKDAHSSKFWELSVAGSTVTARYGKIGTNGQTSVKELDSPEQAQEHARKQAAGKLKKGYQEI